MEETTTATHAPRRTRCRWPRMLAIILLVVALLGLLYWWRAPKRLHRVATCTGAEEFSLSPFTAGFFIRPATTPLSCAGGTVSRIGR